MTQKVTNQWKTKSQTSNKKWQTSKNKWETRLKRHKLGKKM